jgi:hypothetical protein
VLRVLLMSRAAVTVSVRPPSFTRTVAGTVGLESAYWEGYGAGLAPRTACRADVVAAIVAARVGRGFKARPGDLLTPPDAQHKLDMASVKSYGLTLAHADLSGFELCSWRTAACTAVCVLNNGNGRYDSVRRAWLWRTDLWTAEPERAAYRMGWELGRAVRKYGHILFRPDVNSDAAWHRILPAMGRTPGVTVYGYSKNPAVMSPTFRADGFRYAYSWNEKSNIARVGEHLARDGKLAAVTGRKRGQPVDADAVRAYFGVGPEVAVADADLTDEWMLADGPVIGDLTAKGDARRLIGHSRFVVDCYPDSKPTRVRRTVDSVNNA